MSRDSLRKHLSMPGMLRAVRACLHRIADPTGTRGISLSDCLMPGPRCSRPGHRRRRSPGGGDPVMARNLRPLSGVGRAPSDTWMRQRLDGAGPRDLRRRLTGIHAALRRGKAPGGGRCPAAIRSSPSTAPGAIPPAVPTAAAAAAGSAAAGRGHAITRPSGPGRPSRHRGGAAAGAGADPERGRPGEERLRAERGGTARRGPPPGAPAHEGDRRRGRAVVQRAERQAIEERDPPFMPGGRPGDHGPLPAGPGPAKPDRHGRGATGRPAPSSGPGGTTGCRPPTRTST